MKKTLIATLIAASAVTSVPAIADPSGWSQGHGRGHKERKHDRYDDRGDRYESRRHDDRRYDRHDDRRYDRHDDRRDYYQPRYRTTDNGVNYWRGDDGRYYCRRSNGTTGLLVGGALGALLGRSVDTRGDRAPGTILGAAAGALLGREVERGRTRCR